MLGVWGMVKPLPGNHPSKIGILLPKSKMDHHKANKFEMYNLSTMGAYPL
jgi:hypothetical protein